MAAVDEVSHKQIVGVGTLAPHLEELHEILKLTVNVAANLNNMNEREGGDLR